MGFALVRPVRRVLVSDLDSDPVDASSATHHLLHVLRARPGERFLLLDGRGGAAIGVLLAGPTPRFGGLERIEAPPAPKRIILLGVPKTTLLEEALTVGTEGGATRFLLVRAQYSPPSEPRIDRLERIIRAAVTQCGRADLPGLVAPSSLGRALEQIDTPQRWLATVGGGPGECSLSATVAVGPEGGWSTTEQEEMGRHGFEPLGVGPYVLRTPTAVGASLARLFSSTG